MEGKNIVLIGMSGAGKSTLGVLLAKSLGKDFIDTDIIIQNHEKLKLQEIIDNRGEDSFLIAEEKAVSELNVSNCVIATGGSVVYSEKAMLNLKKNGISVYLSVDSDELISRLTNIKSRGIVMKSGESFDDVLKKRLPLYEKYADITINCTGKDIESCVNKLIEKIENCENNHV